MESLDKMKDEMSDKFSDVSLKVDIIFVIISNREAFKKKFAKFHNFQSIILAK